MSEETNQDKINGSPEPLAEQPPSTFESSRDGITKRGFVAFRKQAIESYQEASDFFKWTFRKRKCPFCLATVIDNKQDYIYNQRVSFCSNCLEELPPLFFKNKSKIITLVGGTDTSKTHFITVLAHQIQESAKIMNVANVDGRIIKGKELYTSYAQLLFDNHRTLDPTRGIDKVEKKPIVLRLNRYQGERVSNMYTSLFDTPGEVFTNLDVLTKHHPHIGNSDAIIYLIDPLNIKNLHMEIAEEMPDFFDLSNIKSGEDKDILNNLNDVFTRAERVRNGKITIPVAFCLSKADLLQSKGTFYFPSEIDNDFLTLKDILLDIEYASQEMLEYLQEFDRPLINHIKGKFGRFAFFPVSPLGKNPTDDYIKGGPEPRGVLHPLIWLLTQLKFIG